MNTNVADLEFKRYFIGWHTLHETKKFDKYEKIFFDLDEITNNLLKMESISSMLQYFDNTMYFELWVDLCSKNSEFFLKKARSYKNKIIDNICENLYYLSENSLMAYLNCEELDFENEIDIETNTIVGKKVSINRVYKILARIIQKLDPKLFCAIKDIILYKLNLKKNSNKEITKIWKSFSISKEGRVQVSSNTMSLVLEFVRNNKDYILEYKSDILSMYGLLFDLAVENLDELEKELYILFLENNSGRIY